MTRPSSSLDAALAFVALLPVVLAPGYFFTRMETAGEWADSEEWRVTVVARAAMTDGFKLTRIPGETLEDVRIVFTLSEGGEDQFGIAREAELAATGPDGAPVDLDDALQTRIREAVGVIRSLPEGTDESCTSRDGVQLICGSRSTDRVTGIVTGRTGIAISVTGPFVAGALGCLALFFLAGRYRGRAMRVAAGITGGVVGAISAWSLSSAADSVIASAVAVEKSLAIALPMASIELPLHDPATGPGFVLFLVAASAVLLIFLHQPTRHLLANLRHRPLIYAAITPAMAGMVLLIFVPFFMGVYLAFLDNDRNFVGLANFVDILSPGETADTNFYSTLGVTALWTFLNVSLHVVIGLALALVLSDARLRGRSWYRVLLIVPWAVPNYITALIWKWIFNTHYGPANAFLALMGLDPVDWLGRSFLTNFTANLVTNTWLGFPFMMVVALGALQSIPRDLYEAAEMDGAGRWARFRDVTLPLLKPALFPAIILGTIWTFNMFNVVYLVSGGAPDNQTNILITEAYRAFRVLKNYGMAAAYSLIIFVILAVYTALTNRMTRAAENVFE